MHGFANVMLIKCWFSVYRNVRGRERNFQGNIACFAYPEKTSGDQKVQVSSLVLI